MDSKDGAAVLAAWRISLLFFIEQTIFVEMQRLQAYKYELMPGGQQKRDMSR